MLGQLYLSCKVKVYVSISSKNPAEFGAGQKYINRVIVMRLSALTQEMDCIPMLDRRSSQSLQVLRAIC